MAGPRGRNLKHAKPTRAWRPVPARQYGFGAAGGVLSAFAFNLCLFFLPIAAATAVLVISRDHLYAYEYSEAGARAVSARVERLNSALIQLDFDRQRQWDDLVAMELMAGDIGAARGLLLSAPGMLPGRIAGQIRSAAGANASDAEIERAALEVLTPGTRSRYEATVPLLSRRAASGAAERRDPIIVIGDERDFELLSRAMIATPESDALQFVLTGYGLGLAGEFTPQMGRGAASLLMASRRDDFPPALEAETRALIADVLPIADFRAAAIAGAGSGDPGAYANASAAFREAISPERASAFMQTLAEIGAVADATSVGAASHLLAHAAGFSDLPRLNLLAQSAGDRAAAAAKRLPRDGELLEAARGELTITRDLAAALAAAGLALLGLIGVLGWMGYQFGRRLWLRMNDDDYGAELVDISASSWRPL
jgi:hypothetical protein